MDKSKAYVDAVIDRLVLTPHRKSIVRGLMHGLSNKELAELHECKIATLKVTLGRIYNQQHVKSRYELMRKIYAKVINELVQVKK